VALLAIFHLNARVVKSSKGQSAVAKAAYNAHDLLTNENTGDRHDYRYKGEVIFSGIFAPKDAPAWVKELTQDRQALWSAVEGAEKRKDAQLAREVEFALPHELTDQQREYLVKDFVRENFVRKGMIADVSIHAPSREGDDRNYHAHVLLTMRRIGSDGFGEKAREWNSKAQLQEWRGQWEHLANRHLERHGHDARIDHRSLEEQGLDREPTIHVGPTATDFEREGIKTERGDMCREVEGRNSQLKKLLSLEKELSSAINTMQSQLNDELKAQQNQKEPQAATFGQTDILKRLYADEKTRQQEKIKEIGNTAEDGINFVIAMQDKGFQVAKNKYGHLTAVNSKGFELSLKTTKEAIFADIAELEKNGLILPSSDQVREEQKVSKEEQQRKSAEKREEYEKHLHRLSATMYSHGGMASQERSAIYEAKRRNSAANIRPLHPDEHKAKQQQKTTLPELKKKQQSAQAGATREDFTPQPLQKREKSGAIGKEASKQVAARTEQTGAKKQKSAAEISREIHEASINRRMQEMHDKGIHSQVDKERVRER